jgi:hypothetical protein
LSPIYLSWHVTPAIASCTVRNNLTVGIKQHGLAWAAFTLLLTSMPFLFRVVSLQGFVSSFLLIAVEIPLPAKAREAWLMSQFAAHGHVQAVVLM